MGTTGALGMHWLDLHEAENMLWLCPMPRCHMKSRSTSMLDIHLRVRHKAHGEETAATAATTTRFLILAAATALYATVDTAATTSFLKIAAATARATVNVTTTCARFTAATITSPDVINPNTETGATLCPTHHPLQGVYRNQHQQQ